MGYPTETMSVIREHRDSGGVVLGGGITIDTSDPRGDNILFRSVEKQDIEPPLKMAQIMGHQDILPDGVSLEWWPQQGERTGHVIANGKIGNERIDRLILARHSDDHVIIVVPSLENAINSKRIRALTDRRLYPNVRFLILSYKHSNHFRDDDFFPRTNHIVRRDDGWYSREGRPSAREIFTWSSADVDEIRSALA